MMTAGLIPTIAALGSAIDIGRVYIVKSQLQAGVDAAALAGARAFAVTDTSPESRGSQVDSYFYGNFPTGYMGTSNLVLTPKFTVENGINETRVTATTVLPFSFMKLFGFARQDIEAVAKAELQPRPLEVMVVLDNTGSMRTNLSGGKTRITALKDAAKDFVDIVHQGGSSRRDLAMGFLPYDVTVNVGNALPSGAVVDREGFNSGNIIYYGGKWPSNPYAWKGCVMNDSTVRDVSSDRTVSEAGAWDLTRWLPNEHGNPPVEPYFVPPMYLPKLPYANASAAQKSNPSGQYYDVANAEPKNNLYRLDVSSFGSTGADYLANSILYRSYLYDYYIGLNEPSSSKDDDVIRPTSNGNSFFNPQSGNNTSKNWYVDWTRIPHYYDNRWWLAPANGQVNPNGGRVDNISSDTTPQPTPNWQCPEEAMLLAYGRQKATYDAYIDEKNAAIYPGNGTIHHSGLLWGYRLLVRDDIFSRSNPTNEQPRRAIVFMTDGLNEIDETPKDGSTTLNYTDRTFTWYGKWADAKNQASSLAANESNTETQMLRRFSKTCANIQREENAPKVYIIALVANSTAVNDAFDQCAPGRVYRTSSSSELDKAFQDVAAELVDLHLVQ